MTQIPPKIDEHRATQITFTSKTLLLIIGALVILLLGVTSILVFFSAKNWTPNTVKVAATNVNEVAADSAAFQKQAKQLKFIGKSWMNSESN